MTSLKRGKPMLRKSRTIVRRRRLHRKYQAVVAAAIHQIIKKLLQDKETAALQTINMEMTTYVIFLRKNDQKALKTRFNVKFVRNGF